MADRSALGMIGLMLGVITVLAVSAGAVTVARGVHDATQSAAPARVITLAAR